VAAAALMTWRNAAAQPIAPSQVTPQTLRPPPAAPSSTVTAPPAPTLQAPAAAAQLDVLVDGVQVDGGFAELAGATQALTAGLVGKRVTVEQIYQVATEIEEAYANAGFALARVAVPPQQLLDHGQLRLVVVDGFIETIDVQGVPERVRDAVAARLRPLQGQRHVTLDEIERRILIAGGLPGLELHSTISPGSSDGGTRLIVDGQQRLLSGYIGGDNRLPGSLGNWQYNANLAVNSPFGYGEQVYTNIGLGADLSKLLAGDPRLKLYGGGVVLPLGNGGISINPEYTHSTTTTSAAPGIPKNVGVFDRYAVRLADPLIRTRSDTLTLALAMESLSQKSAAPTTGTDISLDRYVVMRGGLTLSTSLPWAAGLQTGFELSRGLGGRGAAQATASGVPLSAVGAAPDFNKATAQAHVSQALPAGLVLDITALVQISFGKPLLRAEQLSLTDAVSAYPSGAFSVDQGATLRGELRHKLNVWAGAMVLPIEPYMFGALGHGHLVRATSVERPVTNAEGVGLGVRSVLPPFGVSRGISFDLELARQFTDVPEERQGWRWNVNFLVSF
jgi:hemolysin activation/secretion protein